jgi:predicted ATPase
MVFGAFIFWLISALGAFWVVNTRAMRSRLRKRGEAATAEVVNVAGTQLYDATRTCTIRYVRANGEETFARLVSSRSRGLAEGTRVPILYLPDRPQVVADSRSVSSSLIPSVIAVALFAALGFLVFFRH